MCAEQQRTWPGEPAPLGATYDPQRGGTNVALWSGGASGVTLCLLDADGTEHERIPLIETTHQIWHAFVPGLGPGDRYGFRVHGPWDPDRGERFNPAKLLLDPYARAVTGGYRAEPRAYGHVHGGSDLVRDNRDSAGHVPLGVVVDESALDRRDRAPRPAIAWADTVLYELHVRGFTRAHPDVPAQLRGTYAGLAHPAVLDYLTGLGITAVDLLPVHHFLSEDHLLAGSRANYWGYNTIGYFAPHAGYAATGSTGEQVSEFRSMVDALHGAGLEVIIDVVYNHTAEGGATGPTLSFRGIDNAAYYRLRDGRFSADVTGCGNTLDVRTPQVLRLITDSLRYWVTTMGVDGFRFDLAPALIRGDDGPDPHAPLLSVLAQDPVLSTVKLIAEPWDLGPGGYVLGGFPPGWGEWNDRYRAAVRDFWRGPDNGAGSGINDLAYRLSGSSDLFDVAGRAPSASVNFITAHDGFTLRDLVTYQAKRNAANGERNRDGTDDNRSWNCGAEGETDDPDVLALRERQSRNMLLTLLLSTGTPMLLAGDERRRTQRGNNNAYCQDNDISWVDWTPGPPAERLAAFTRDLLALRRENPVFRRRRFFTGGGLDEHAHADLTWFGPQGEELTEHDWHDPHLHSLGMLLSGRAISERGPRGEPVTGDSFLVVLHGGADGVDFCLPRVPGMTGFEVVLHTATGTGSPRRATLHPGAGLSMPGRSAAVLRLGPPAAG